MKCSQCGQSTSFRLVRVRWPLVAVVLGMGLLAAYGLGGQLLHDLIEGQRRDQLPLWKLWLPLGLLLAGVGAAFARLRKSVCDACDAISPPWLWSPLSQRRAAEIEAMSPSRRAILRSLGVGGAGLAAAAGGVGAAVLRNHGWVGTAGEIFMAEVEKTAPSPRSEWTEARVRGYRRLGRTNVMVSDISLGSSRIRDEEIARQALDRGLNYFDTSPDYADTGSEQVLGRAMKGRRDGIFVATKFCVANGHLLNDTPVPQIIAAVEGSLNRLQTDYVDLIHIHSCDRVDRLMAPNIHEAFDRLKEQGKVKFLGFSCHSPNLEEVANEAIDSGRFDVMMLAYHFGMWPSFGHILERAKQNDVGVVAMKTLKGAKHANLAKFRREADSYAQAAFRWVLSDANVSCLVVSFSEMQHVQEYLHASGAKLQPTDVALLRRYDELIAGDYCQPHCGACLSSCRYELAINDVLRYRMYFKDYGWEKEAMRQYAKLERSAALCASCNAPCAETCPTGVPIREKMMEAHELLTFPA